MVTANDIDRADNRSKRVAAMRSIKLPGRVAKFADDHPVEIARELRRRSALGKIEAALDKAERV